jgi:AmmeMemoRadiSam system protein A
MLDETERSELLNLAERSIARGLYGPRESLPDRTWSPRLLERRATFTTLKIQGQLRGCCGSVDAQRALVEDVWRSAWNSAYADPRFWPVPHDELGLLEISISVLSPLEPLPVSNDVDLIGCLRPRIDGLVLRQGERCATFLPAVWESLPDPHDFVAQLKRKANLSYSQWPAGLMALRYCTETFCSDSKRVLAA